VLRCLSRNGCIQSPELRGGLPALAQLEPDRCYLSLGFDYLSDQPLAGIRQSFECCLDQSTLSITRADTLPFRAAPVAEAPAVEVGTLAPGGAPGAREAPVPSRAADGVVRVDGARLEQLVNLVGELVIANAASGMLASQSGNEHLVESNATVTRLVEDIRDSALTLRMVPVGESFQRFDRLAVEMGHELGKEVDLTLSGGDVELDKAVAEKMGDQLMHLVRNAIDHGIETPQERAAAGKPTRGRLALNAWHESGSVIIQVVDDGRGMDLEKLLGRARAAGLVADDRRPSDEEILQFAFHPGMSTAERISQFSGRGVGLDAVRRKVESLRGRVELASEQGKGTTVSICLPLTLSIIDGFRVAVAGHSYVLSLDSVIECIEVERGSAGLADNGYTNLRGEALPLLRLRDLFGEPAPDREQRENILVVSSGRQKAGLVVDELLGEYQTVIKPLGRLFGKARGVSGATILGSGEVALILDVPQLIESAKERSGGSAQWNYRAPDTAARRQPAWNQDVVTG
jgi:two-component system chemotaxis sensor kinase CheA